MNRLRQLTLCLLVLTGSAWQAKAQLITSSPDLPPLAGQYIGVQQAHQLYQTGALSLEVIDIRHTGFAASFPPPPNVGNMTSHSFGSTVFGDLVVNGGAPQPFSASAQVSVNVTKVSGTNGSPLGSFDNQMTQLDITGLPGGIEIRVDPTQASTGQTNISDAGGGMFRIDSFFDIFTDISLDSGATWIPSTGSAHVVLAPLVPEPSAVHLFGIGIVGTTLLYRRRRSRLTS
jgi:hypothetical protein